MGFSQLLGGGVRTEVVKIHNFFFSNESFPKHLKPKAFKLEKLTLKSTTFDNNVAYFQLNNTQFCE